MKKSRFVTPKRVRSATVRLWIDVEPCMNEYGSMFTEVSKV